MNTYSQSQEIQENLPWFKGNLRPLPAHCFKYPDSLKIILEIYEAQGYDFLALPPNVSDAKSFKNHSMNFFPFKQLINDDEFRFELNAINVLSSDNTPHDEYYYDLLEEYIDTIKKEGNDNISFINAGIFRSEDFYWIIKESNVKFIELYNGYAEESKVSPHFRDVEDVWDMINAERCREEKQLIYGLVNEKRLLSEGGNGHIVVNAKSKDPYDLFEAINAGHFYNSTGVVLEEVKYAHRELDGKIFPCVFVKIKPEPGVTYKIEVIQIGDSGDQISSVENKTEDWTTVDNHTLAERNTLFSRIKVTSSKIVLYNGDIPQFETAWTQPFIFH